MRSSTWTARVGENSSQAQSMNASTRVRTPVISEAWTPSHITKATVPCTSWRRLPTSATAALRPIMAMMPLSL